MLDELGFIPNSVGMPPIIVVGILFCIGAFVWFLFYFVIKGDKRRLGWIFSIFGIFLVSEGIYSWFIVGNFYLPSLIVGILLLICVLFIDQKQIIFEIHFNPIVVFVGVVIVLIGLGSLISFTYDYNRLNEFKKTGIHAQAQVVNKDSGRYLLPLFTRPILWTTDLNKWRTITIQLNLDKSYEKEFNVIEGGYRLYEVGDYIDVYYDPRNSRYFLSEDLIKYLRKKDSIYYLFFPPLFLFWYFFRKKFYNLLKRS